MMNIKFGFTTCGAEVISGTVDRSVWSPMAVAHIAAPAAATPMRNAVPRERTATAR
jgi:hypothetical protein